MMAEWINQISNKNLELEEIKNQISIIVKNTIILSENGEKIYIKLLKQYGFEKVLNAINLAHEKYNNDIFLDKVGGILYLQNASPEKRTISYIKGICKNRFNYFNATAASIMLQKYFSIYDNYDDCIEFAKKMQKLDRI